MSLLLRWLASMAALLLTVKLGQARGLPFFVAPGVKGAEGLALMTAALGIVNAVVRPVAQMVALPLTCLTLGLFGFVVNALLFWGVGQIVPGFHVGGFVAPLFGTIVMGLISGLLNMFIVPRREQD